MIALEVLTACDDSCEECGCGGGCEGAGHPGSAKSGSSGTGVIGPYDFRGSMMGSVIHSAAVRKPMFYVDGAYDFVDVRDVADGLIRAAEHGKRGESYILSGQRISVR